VKHACVVNNISGTVSVIDTATNMVTNDANTVLVIDRAATPAKKPHPERRTNRLSVTF